jgi:glycosyltransferase involved in cell wall biosynthesis
MSKPNPSANHRAPAAKPPGATIAVVIPARNEEGALPLVVAEIPRGWADRVIVVDNGSTDRTAAAARAAGATVVREPRPGYGRACLRGLAELGRKPTEFVVFLDADHSDYPEEIPRLLDPLLRGDADLVIGSRALGKRQPGAIPPHARLGNRLAVFLIRMRFGHRYTDLGPMRAIRYRRLLDLGMRDTDYGWTVEMQVRALRHGLRVVEVPVRYRRRVGVSKVSGTVRGSLGAGFKILWVICREAWRRR